MENHQKIKFHQKSDKTDLKFGVFLKELKNFQGGFKN